MAIVPVGKLHLMEAQTINNPLMDGAGGPSMSNNIPSFETEEGLNEEVEETGGPEPQVDIGGPQEEIGGVEEPTEGRKTLTNYVFKKLENYGYPGRRLQEFKAKFVRETVSPEGIKDIQIEIPDKKYPNAKGQTDTIENEELSSISKEINEMFGLNFNGAERTDGKWTIKFTSADNSDPTDGDIVRDNLDEVYGTPNKSKNETHGRDPMKTQARTIYEMIKENKSKVISELEKISGE